MKHTYIPASLFRRLAAAFYDLLLIFGLLMLYGFIGVALKNLQGDSAQPMVVGGFWFSLGMLSIVPLYFCGCWSLLGQTPGMRAWGLGLLTAEGRRGSIGKSLLRFGAALLSWLALGAGFWWSLFDAEKRCWHDYWSGLYLLRLPGS